MVYKEVTKLKAVVTGGAGFIGSHVARKYIKEGINVVVIDDLSAGDVKNVPDQAKFVKLDITEKDEIKDFFREEDPDIVNHHAAHNDSMTSLENPQEDAEINVIGSINILEAARASNVEKIIYASSGGLSYGEPNQIPTTEDHEMKPSYPYGISKHSVEHYLDLYKDLHGLDFTVLRYASVYGPGANGGVIKNFLEAVSGQKKPIIFGKGEQTRDFIHVKDIARANYLAIDNGKGYYNIGTCTETTVNKLWEIVADVTSSDKKPEYKERWLGDIDRCRLDCSKAEKEMDWKPKIGLKEGIRRTWTK